VIKHRLDSGNDATGRERCRTDRKQGGNTADQRDVFDSALAALRSHRKSMRVWRRRRPRTVAMVRRALWRRTHHPLRVAHGSAYTTSGSRLVLDATASRLRVFFVRRLSV
jgi:hypothetical protein